MWANGYQTRTPRTKIGEIWNRARTRSLRFGETYARLDKETAQNLVPDLCDRMYCLSIFSFIRSICSKKHVEIERSMDVVGPSNERRSFGLISIKRKCSRFLRFGITFNVSKTRSRNTVSRWTCIGVTRFFLVATTFFVDFLLLLDSIVNCFVGSVRFVTKDINFGTTYRMNSFEIENPMSLHDTNTSISDAFPRNGRASPLHVACTCVRASCRSMA